MWLNAPWGWVNTCMVMILQGWLIRTSWKAKTVTWYHPKPVTEVLLLCCNSLCNVSTSESEEYPALQLFSFYSCKNFVGSFFFFGAHHLGQPESCSLSPGQSAGRKQLGVRWKLCSVSLRTTVSNIITCCFHDQVPKTLLPQILGPVPFYQRTHCFLTFRRD